MKHDTPLTVRLPRETVEALDAYAARLRETHPGPRWSRSDVVRLLLDRGLRSDPPRQRPSERV